MVGVTLFLVPDRISSRVGFSGHCCGIYAVSGAGIEGSICISAGHKGLGRAVVHTIICRQYRHCGVRLRNGRSGIGRDGDVVLGIGRISDKRTGEGHLFICPDMFVCKCSRQGLDFDLVIPDQSALLPCDVEVGVRLGVVHLVVRGDNGRNRLFQRVERVGRCHRIIVAAARLGCGDRGGAYPLDGHKTVGVNMGNILIAAAPCNFLTAGAAYCA